MPCQGSRATLEVIYPCESALWAASIPPSFLPPWNWGGKRLGHLQEMPNSIRLFLLEPRFCSPEATLIEVGSRPPQIGVWHSCGCPPHRWPRRSCRAAACDTPNSRGNNSRANQLVNIINSLSLSNHMFKCIKSQHLKLLRETSAFCCRIKL